MVTTKTYVLSFIAFLFLIATGYVANKHLNGTNQSNALPSSKDAVDEPVAPVVEEEPQVNKEANKEEDLPAENTSPKETDTGAARRFRN